MLGKLNEILSLVSVTIERVALETLPSVLVGGKAVEER